MEDDEHDEMLMVEADFEIIKKLTNKIDLLDNNLNKLINNNNIFIENMLIVKIQKDLNTENDNNNEAIQIENLKSNDKDITLEDITLNDINIDIIKNKLYNMKIEELKDICKKNKIKKYTGLNKSKLIDYIVNYKNVNKLEF
jgi:hypothetical protein